MQLRKTGADHNRILLVIATLSAGGAEGFVANLGASFAELGYEVRVFLLAGVRDDRGLSLLKRLETAGVTVIGKQTRLREPNIMPP